MAHSLAYQEFKDALGMAEELLNVERERCNNPPRQSEQKTVQGLRGGAAILMVAAFENFLRRAFEEHLSELTRHPRVTFEKLPEKMQVSCFYLTLERAMKGPPFEEPLPKIQRLIDIDKACRDIISGIVNPQVFCDTGSNPNSKTVKLMFSNIGIQKIFENIKEKFEAEWGRSLPQAFIEKKLDEVINRRHVVAHTANTLDITRSDMNEALRFLKILARLLDLELKKHVQLVKA